MAIFSQLPPGWWRARRYHLIAPLVALAVTALLAMTTDLVELVEDMTINLRFQARSAFDPPADDRLRFLAIDEFSLSYLHRWPWPRSVEANALDIMTTTNDVPHTISFDVTFTESSDQATGQNTASDAKGPDELFVDAISNYGSVITGAQSLSPIDLQGDVMVEEAKKQTKEALANLGPTVPLTQLHGPMTQYRGSDMANFPIPPLRAQSFFAFVNDNPSLVDDIRHNVPLVIRVQDKVFPSLALQTLCQMLGVDADKVDVDIPSRFIKLTSFSGKSWTIPVNEHGEYAINYRAQKSFKSISFGGLVQNLHDYWQDLNDPKIPAEKKRKIAPDCDVRNKTLFVGESAFALGDLGPTPLNSRSPLPYVHLNVINNVLKGDYLHFIPLFWVVIGWSLITWPTIIRLKVAPLGEAVLVPIALVLGYIAVAFAIFGYWSIQIALAWPVISYASVNFGGVVLRWREEQKGRQQIRGVFAQMLSPEVVNHLLKHPENLQLGGADRPSTVLFSDIRDYTKFSEGKTAQEVMRQLNTYFERMVPCITEKKGTVHKFIGDAVMAAWGDIAESSMGPEQDARNAVSSALWMRVKLRELNDERKELGLTPIRIGVGLNHGIVQAGILGSTGRKEFTMIGDEVNVASRLEGITKEFHTDLAISESVRLLLDESFLVRRLGFIQLKGKTQATLVYEVLGEKSDLSGVKMSPAGVAQYETAFDHFLARRFAEADAAFVTFQKDYPDDFCAMNYLKASREFTVTPPSPEWDGRIVMTTK